MARLILIFVIFSISQCFSQSEIYEFETINKRNNNGWSVTNNKGEVQFKKNRLSIITEQSVYEFEVVNKSYWINDSSIMLSCNDWVGRSVILRLLVDSKEKMNSDKIELFFHFDNEESVYYKINLTKCKYE